MYRRCYTLVYSSRRNVCRRNVCRRNVCRRSAVDEMSVDELSWNQISVINETSNYIISLIMLHWLPLQQRIMFRIGAMVWRCILGLAPAYLRDPCCPTSGTRGRSSLRSSVTLCSFSSYIHNPGPCILGGWPLCVEWASFFAKIAPQDSF